MNYEKKYKEALERAKSMIGDWVKLPTSKSHKVTQIIDIQFFKTGEPQYITSDGRWFGNGTYAKLWTSDLNKHDL